MSKDELQMQEKCFEVAGLHGHIRLIFHPKGIAMNIDLRADTILSPEWIEAALYDVAAHIAHQHGLTETIRKTKEDTWS